MAEKHLDNFGEILQVKAYLGKYFKKICSTDYLLTTFPQIACKIILNSHAIVKIIIDPDDNFKRNS